MQQVLTILIVAIAAAYLARAAWIRFYGEKGGTCGSCSNCSSANDSIKSRPLINISLDMSHAEAQKRGESRN
jgi:FeoB-associated Cys-rich membrane protein